MRSTASLLRMIKLVLVGGFALSLLFWAVSSSFSKPARPEETKAAAGAIAAQGNSEDYVGAETCKACHEDQFKNFSKTAHAKLPKLSGWSVKDQGCESCHGPGKAHVEGGGDKTKIQTFENASSKQKSDACLRCHSGKEEHNNFRRGEHWRNDVGCTDCHSPHSETSGSAKMVAMQQPGLCQKCHTEVKAEFAKPFHHRVPEGIIKCSDCHNPHGGFELKQVRLATGGDAPCLKCHTDKQGPFVFEHAPLKIEGCTACHIPHGSNNPKLLKRNQVNQLCLECHSDVGAILGVTTPSFHDQTTLRFQNCTTCHVRIHGSNADTNFFR